MAKAKKKSNNVVKMSDRMPKIESGVPIPPMRPTKYDWLFADKMKQGDSVFLSSKLFNKNAHQSLRKLLIDRHGWTVTTRRETQNGVDGMRVWRVN